MAEGQQSLGGSLHYLPHQLVWRVTSTGVSAPVLEPIVLSPPLIGRLTVTVLRAKRLHNVASFGQMDVFVEAKVADQRAKTTVAKRGHVTPEWGAAGEPLVFQLNGQEPQLRLRVFHKTLLGEAAVGTARLPLDSLLLLHGRSPADTSIQPPTNCANTTLNCAWIEIGRDTNQSVAAGSLLISVHFELASQAGLLASCALPPMDAIGAGRFHLTPDPTSSSGAPPTLGGLIAASPFKPKDRSASVSSTPPVPAPSPTPGNIVVVSQAQASASSSSSTARLFGGSLANGMARSRSSVPVVVFICIQYLLHHGLKCVGIFRIASQSEAQEALKKCFESGSSIEVSDPHVTGDVLKSYFRLLSDPLIPSAMYSQFLAAAEMKPDEAVPQLKKLLGDMPDDNVNVLSYLLHFLTLVAAESDVNRMPAESLAMVFSPNLLRKGSSNAAPGVSDTQASMAKEFSKGKDCIFLLIKHYNTLFPRGPPNPFALAHPEKDRPTVAPLRVVPPSRPDFPLSPSTPANPGQ